MMDFYGVQSYKILFFKKNISKKTTGAKPSEKSNQFRPF